ncbi:MAG TPA: hypothetical protein VFG76_08320, partial [Candidatus Polarisedimenticolia bacterium]|nr:hypothetical protein [Candidatus Polarisedimenticolia bacterium]
MRYLVVLLGLHTLIGAPPSFAAGAHAKPIELKLTGGAFRPLAPGRQDPPAWYEPAARPTSARGLRYLVAITTGPLTPAQRAQIESAGAELLDYVPVNGYRLRVPASAVAALSALPYVAWLGELPPHHKVHPDLAAEAGHPSSAVRIRVILDAGEPSARALEVLSRDDPRAAPAGKDGAFRIEATIPAGR